MPRTLAVSGRGLSSFDNLDLEFIRVRDFTQTVSLCNVSVTMLRRVPGGDGKNGSSFLGADVFKILFFTVCLFYGISLF